MFCMFLNPFKTNCFCMVPNYTNAIRTGYLNVILSEVKKNTKIPYMNKTGFNLILILPKGVYYFEVPLF